MIVGLLLSSCSVAASPASCAFIVGDGTGIGSSDSNLRDIVYPGQDIVYDSGDANVSYVPCNSRNFIINDGSVKSAHWNMDPIVFARYCHRLDGGEHPAP